MTAPDLRTLAIEALDDMSDCPPEHWGGRDICDVCDPCKADAVLAAVLPAHRQQVLGEARDAITDTPFDLVISYGPAVGGYLRPGAVDLALRHLASPNPSADETATPDEIAAITRREDI
jgi:hypothetical protein